MSIKVQASRSQGLEDAVIGTRTSRDERCFLHFGCTNVSIVKSGDGSGCTIITFAYFERFCCNVSNCMDDALYTHWTTIFVKVYRPVYYYSYFLDYNCQFLEASRRIASIVLKTDFHVSFLLKRFLYMIKLMTVNHPSSCIS